jgi:hypothetical protein
LLSELAREHSVDRVARHARIHKAISANAPVSGSRHAANAPIATETTAAATVTWFAVTPARASTTASGRSKAWKRGFNA